MTREDVIQRLQAAILRRQALRPGSRAHWSNECEIKVLQRAIAAEAGRTEPVGRAVDSTSPWHPAE